MKFLLIAGHGAGDSGAVGCGYKEADLTRELVNLIHIEMMSRGVNHDVFDMGHNMYQDLKNGEVYDFTPYRAVLEVHFNALKEVDYKGDGVLRGTMFYVHPNDTNTYPENLILQKLYSLGSKKAWDGVVLSTQNYNGGLLVNNRVTAQSVKHSLIETCFISDKDDMNWYQSKKYFIAKAIVDGLVSAYSYPTRTLPYQIKVTDSALNYRTSFGVGNPVAGTITDKGIYTIVAEGIASEDGALWGKLKSGAGWINLRYTCSP